MNSNIMYELCGVVRLGGIFSCKILHTQKNNQNCLFNIKWDLNIVMLLSTFSHN